MNVVDSSGWLEYYTDGKNADFFAPAIENTEELIVPTISIYEIFKKVSKAKNESDAIKIVGQMSLGKIIDMDRNLALFAAKLGIELNLPMADSIILATARIHSATLWTQDSDFHGIENVNFKPKIK